MEASEYAAKKKAALFKRVKADGAADPNELR